MTVDVPLVRLIDPDDNRQSSDDEPRFTLLETIRAYGEEMLQARSDEQAVRSRHAGYVCVLAEAAERGIVGTLHTTWLDRLEMDVGNIRAALRWTIEHGDRALAQRIGGSLWLWWFLRGHLQEGRRWLAEIIALSPDAGVDVGWAKVLTGAGALAELQGDEPEATRQLDAAIAVCDTAGDRRLGATARFFRGLVAFDQGNLTATRELARQSLETFGELADSWGTALALAELGMVELRLGDTERAANLLTESRLLFRTFGITWGVAMTTANLGLVAQERRDYLRCEAMLIEAIALFHTIGDRWGIAMYLDSLARAACENGRLVRAATLFGAHAALCDAIGVGVKPLYRGGYVSNLEAAQAGLGDSLFAETFARGRSLTVERTIAFAASDELTTMAPPPGHVLSPREIEVLRLISRGQSDRQIGEALFISVRTVSTHVSNIFAKLGVGSRTLAATEALTRGLV